MAEIFRFVNYYNLPRYIQRCNRCDLNIPEQCVNCWKWVSWVFSCMCRIFFNVQQPVACACFVGDTEIHGKHRNENPKRKLEEPCSFDAPTQVPDSGFNQGCSKEAGKRFRAVPQKIHGWLSICVHNWFVSCFKGHEYCLAVVYE